MAKRITRASVITVDIKNSVEDIENGGPNYNSYNFIVDSDDADNMVRFIGATFKKLMISFDYIYESRYLYIDRNHLLDKDGVYREVKRLFNSEPSENNTHKLVLK